MHTAASVVATATRIALSGTVARDTREGHRVIHHAFARESQRPTAALLRVLPGRLSPP